MLFPAAPWSLRAILQTEALVVHLVDILADDDHGLFVLWLRETAVAAPPPPRIIKVKPRARGLEEEERDPQLELFRPQRKRALKAAQARADAPQLPPDEAIANALAYLAANYAGDDIVGALKTLAAHGKRLLHSMHSVIERSKGLAGEAAVVSHQTAPRRREAGADLLKDARAIYAASDGAANGLARGLDLLARRGGLGPSGLQVRVRALLLEGHADAAWSLVLHFRSEATVGTLVSRYMASHASLNLGDMLEFGAACMRFVHELGAGIAMLTELGRNRALAALLVQPEMEPVALLLRDAAICHNVARRAIAAMLGTLPIALNAVPTPDAPADVETGLQIVSEQTPPRRALVQTAAPWRDWVYGIEAVQLQMNLALLARLPFGDFAETRAFLARAFPDWLLFNDRLVRKLQDALAFFANGRLGAYQATLRAVAQLNAAWAFEDSWISAVYSELVAVMADLESVADALRGIMRVAFAEGLAQRRHLPLFGDLIDRAHALLVAPTGRGAADEPPGLLALIGDLMHLCNPYYEMVGQVLQTCATEPANRAYFSSNPRFADTLLHRRVRAALDLFSAQHRGEPQYAGFIGLVTPHPETGAWDLFADDARAPRADVPAVFAAGRNPISARLVERMRNAVPNFLYAHLFLGPGEMVCATCGTPVALARNDDLGPALRFYYYACATPRCFYERAPDALRAAMDRFVAREPLRPTEFSRFATVRGSPLEQIRERHGAIGARIRALHELILAAGRGATAEDAPAPHTLWGRVGAFFQQHMANWISTGALAMALHTVTPALPDVVPAFLHGLAGMLPGQLRDIGAVAALGRGCMWIFDTMAAGMEQGARGWTRAAVRGLGVFVGLAAAGLVLGLVPAGSAMVVGAIRSYFIGRMAGLAIGQISAIGGALLGTATHHRGILRRQIEDYTRLMRFPQASAAAGAHTNLLIGLQQLLEEFLLLAAAAPLVERVYGALQRAYGETLSDSVEAIKQRVRALIERWIGEEAAPPPPPALSPGWTGPVTRNESRAILARATDRIVVDSDRAFTRISFSEPLLNSTNGRLSCASLDGRITVNLPVYVQVNTTHILTQMPLIAPPAVAQMAISDMQIGNWRPILFGARANDPNAGAWIAYLAEQGAIGPAPPTDAATLDAAVKSMQKIYTNAFTIQQIAAQNATFAEVCRAQHSMYLFDAAETFAAARAVGSDVSPEPPRIEQTFFGPANFAAGMAELPLPPKVPWHEQLRGFGAYVVGLCGFAGTSMTLTWIGRNRTHGARVARTEAEEEAKVPMAGAVDVDARALDVGLDYAMGAPLAADVWTAVCARCETDALVPPPESVLLLYETVTQIDAYAAAVEAGNWGRRRELCALAVESFAMLVERIGAQLERRILPAADHEVMLAAAQEGLVLCGGYDMLRPAASLFGREDDAHGAARGSAQGIADPFRIEL